MTEQQLDLHSRAVELSRQHRALESDIVFILAKIERERIFLKLGYESLFGYAVKALGLTESSAYAFITISRKCQDLEVLKDAIANKDISVTKAARLVSVLTKENASELLEFAMSHTSREIDAKVAEIRPRAKVRDRIRPLSKDWLKLEGSISHGVAKQLKRAQAVLASKLGRNPDLNMVLEAALGAYLSKNDPLEKAKRSLSRPQQLCTNRVKKGRSPLTAAQRHTVHLRDKGRCTFVNPLTKERCTNDRWLEKHHIVGVKDGGGNDPENIRTLCSLHHDLVHQMTLPVEGEGRADVNQESG